LTFPAIRDIVNFQGRAMEVDPKRRCRDGDKRSTLKAIVLLLTVLIVLPHLSCEGQKTQSSRPKTNLPPVVLTATVLPEKAYRGTELTIAVQGKDPDGDSVSFQFQWIKNDTEMVGEKSNSLKGDRFNKGDLIRVRVTPSDGKAEGPPFLSSPVAILNAAPEIREVWIEPRRPGAGDNLKAYAKGFDPDGDFVYYNYRWEKNGEVLPEEKGAVLEQGRFKKGDSLAVIITPDDREIQGPPKKSELVLISNSPPIIHSSPPDTLKGTAYRYQVKANDPDQDPVTFILKSAPKGMVMDKGTGLIQWEVGKEDKGTYPIEIEATDNEGGKSVQRFTLTIDFK
jgi:hypothetical protein